MQVYLLDFGLASLWRDAGEDHVEETATDFKGTLHYASPQMLHGRQCSRKHDIMSLGYLLICVRKGDLPWLVTSIVIFSRHYSELLHETAMLRELPLFSAMPTAQKP